MLARFNASAELSDPVAYPRSAEEVEGALYRLSEVDCREVIGTRSTAARNLQGAGGLAQVARCSLASGGETEVMLGWARGPQEVDWQGGQVSGWIAPAKNGARLVANPPVAGLSALPRPDPNTLPNNHMAYAGQWFLFALTALVIYGFAVRSRIKQDAG
jgi:surfeit locus 1 family protein